MTEKLLHFIWQFGYFNKASLCTEEGEEIIILHPGSLNANQGPDFTNAKIKIGSTIFAGTVELHLKTSDWKKHKHEEDLQYKNVILHVVLQHDVVVNNIPVLSLQTRVSSLLLDRYAFFMNNAAFIPCNNLASGVKELTWMAWKERVLVERLSRKANRINGFLVETNLHWQETFWWLLARSFGTKINADAFESIARSLPVNLLAKHKSSIHQLEALLLGQANLLTGDFEEDYPKLLQREYAFLQKKYNLIPASFPVLFLRMRPGNFPTIRLAQLAMLMHQASHLFSILIDTEKLEAVKQMFAITPNDFWHYHYLLHQASAFKPKALGADTIDGLIINTVVPILFAYGLHHQEEKYKLKALRWLEEVRAEKNSITKGFMNLGIKNSAAYDSQALIELHNEYCQHKRCLQCSIGNNLLREAAASYQLPIGSDR